MAKLELADIKQLLDAMESRLNGRIDGVDSKLEKLSKQMNDSFADVGDALDRIFMHIDRFEVRLDHHGKALKRLDPEFEDIS